MVLRAGRHQINTTLVLAARHRGTSWRAMPGERVFLSGGIVLPTAGWKRIDQPAGSTSIPPPAPRGSVWVTPLPIMSVHARQIYVNGVRAARPAGNASVILGAMTRNGPQPSTGGAAPGPGYTVALPGLKGWRNPEDMEFTYERQLTYCEFLDLILTWFSALSPPPSASPLHPSWHVQCVVTLREAPPPFPV